MALVCMQTAQEVMMGSKPAKFNSGEDEISLETNLYSVAVTAPFDS
jgi:hypothetical protein